MPKIPEAIQRQEDRAKALHEQQKQKAELAKVAAQQTPQNPPPVAPQQPPPQQPAVTQPQPQPPPQLKPSAPEKAEDVQYWRQRANSLGGMISAKDREIIQLREQTNAQLQQMQAQVATLTEKLQAAETERQKAKQATLLSALESEYPDENDPTRRLMTEMSEQNQNMYNEIAKLKAESVDLSGRVSNVTQAQEVNVVTAFWNALDEKYPNRETTNSDPAFYAFMHEPDPDAGYYGWQTGTTRQQILDAAVHRFDAPAVIRYYDEWNRVSNQPEQPQPSDNSPPYQPSGPSPTNGGDQQKKIWTTSEVKQFYANWRQGKIKNEDAVALERDIQAAVNENRYRPGI